MHRAGVGGWEDGAYFLSGVTEHSSCRYIPENNEVSDFIPGDGLVHFCLLITRYATLPLRQEIPHREGNRLLFPLRVVM